MLKRVLSFVLTTAVVATVGGALLVHSGVLSDARIPRIAEVAPKAYASFSLAADAVGFGLQVQPYRVPVPHWWER